MVDIRKHLYGAKPEYCVVVDHFGRALQDYEGTFGSVTFNWQKLLELILDDRVSYILHSHPFGLGTQYSALDKEVFESWAVVTGKNLVHKITDFKEVRQYVVTRKGSIYTVDLRLIPIWESLSRWPWGLKL